MTIILNRIFNYWVPKLLTGLPGSLKKLVSVCSECSGQPSLPKKKKGDFQHLRNLLHETGE
jgi:hypothetical protein